MRIAALILGILGGLASGALGMTWISDYNKSKELIESMKAMGAAGAELGALDGMVTAAYIMLAGLVIGIVGGILALKGKGKIGGPLMIIFAILPAFFAGKALIFTFLLLIGGVLAVISKPADA